VSAGRRAQGEERRAKSAEQGAGRRAQGEERRAKSAERRAQGEERGAVQSIFGKKL